MAKFERVQPSFASTIEEYKADKVTVTIMAYAFGQHRVQVWYDGYGEYPDILGPECWSYKPEVAREVTTKIRATIESLPEATHAEVNKAWKQVARDIGWDGRDVRIRLDDVGK